MYNSCFLYSFLDGRVVHSEGRLIPHQFPITDLQQIHAQDGAWRITCSVTNGTAVLFKDDREVESNGPLETAVTVNGNSNSYQNRGLYCNSNDTNYFYLYLTSSNNSEYGNVTVLCCACAAHIIHTIL